MTKEDNGQAKLVTGNQPAATDVNQGNGQYPLRRIDGTYIINEISSVIFLDKGILYTIKELLIRPGDTV
jgi:hypothetical protein